MAGTRNAKFMHCLPVRRNVVVSDAVLDGGNSVVLQQAHNRVFAAQAVLRRMLLAAGR
jgi:N-succinyl-L-ornithine transcarbamylase